MRRIGLFIGVVACGGPPSATPTPTPGVTPTATPTPASLPHLNELSGANDATVQLDDGSLPDWIELIGPGDAAFDLSRATLDDGTTPCALSGTLAAGALALVWADDRLEPDHCPFKLKGGETVTLRVDGAVVDQVEVPDAGPDVAAARWPDRDGAWDTTVRPTPGAPNAPEGRGETDATEVVYDPLTVHALDIGLSDAAWDALVADPYTDVEGAITVDGVVLSPVHVRLKGSGSFRPLPSGKSAFKIDLDDLDDHTWRGVRKITLNNMVQDPSYVHELLTYTVHRALGVPAPRVGYAHVRVNGEVFGVYTLSETFDDDYLARWFADPGGQLWEGGEGSDLVHGQEILFDLDEGPDPKDTSALATAADALLLDPTDPASLAALEAVLDLDGALAMLAGDALAWHRDDYTRQNNFRLYVDPADGRMTPLPCGADAAWQSEGSAPYGGRSRIVMWCLASSACRARYDAILLASADAVEALALDQTADATLAVLQPWIAVDARKEWSGTEHADAVALVHERIAENPGWLRDVVAAGP